MFAVVVIKSCIQRNCLITPGRNPKHQICPPGDLEQRCGIMLGQNWDVASVNKTMRLEGSQHQTERARTQQKAGVPKRASGPGVFRWHPAPRWWFRNPKQPPWNVYFPPCIHKGYIYIFTMPSDWPDFWTIQPHETPPENLVLFWTPKT